MRLDLHTHSIYSDGSLTPEEIVDASVELGLSAIAITDHDNVLAYDIAKSHVELKSREAGKPVIELIPGIEINTFWKNNEIHILGYYMDITSKSLNELIAYQQHARIEQASQIAENLVKKESINIKLEDITSLVTKGGSIGRPHIAKAIANITQTRNFQEIYNKYINDNAPAYVRRNSVSPHEAVETIYESFGIPVIAHPCDLEIAESLIKELINYGLRGVEAYHRKHSPAMVEYYSSIAEANGLIVTGGSDCHGPKSNKHLLLGKNIVPGWILDKLKEEKSRIEMASC